jgi:hypothetical protein
MRLLTLSIYALFIVPFAVAQETGSFSATCDVQGAPSQMQMSYARYRDVEVWQDRHGQNSQTTDMGQWGPTQWQGTIDTPFGQYRLTGENQFVEAWLVGGVYSDKITLELTQTGEYTFTMRDFFSDAPPIHCEISGR